MHDTKFLEIETINMHDIAALGSNLRSRVNKLAKSPNELQFIQKELSKKSIKPSDLKSNNYCKGKRIALKTDFDTLFKIETSLVLLSNPTSKW